MSDTRFNFVPNKCINCDKSFQSSRRFYCGEHCRQTCEHIRYVRSKIAEGTANRPDIAEAIRVRLSKLLGGGYYDKNARKVKNEDRHNLLIRSVGYCEKCGIQFTDNEDGRFTVQHTSVEVGFKLEAWCYRCNMDHAQSVVLTLKVEDQKFLDMFNLRVKADKPLKICDDHENWDEIFRQIRLEKQLNKPKKHIYKPNIKSKYDYDNNFENDDDYKIFD